MNAKTVVALGLVHVLLAGCYSAEERQRRRALAAEQEAAYQAQQREAYRQRVFSQCRSYGFVEGSPQFRDCVMQVDMANRQRAAQQENVILQQMLQDESARQQRSLPLCSSLPPGTAGYARAQGTCR